MPMIELTVPRGALPSDTTDRLLDDLASCLLRWEQAPDTDFFREITWAHVHEVDTGSLRVNGSPATRFRVEVTVPAGAFSQRRKDGLIGEVHQIVGAATGLSDDRALHIWTLIHEVPDGNWGAGGQTVHYEQLKALAARERSAAPS